MKSIVLRDRIYRLVARLRLPSHRTLKAVGYWNHEAWPSPVAPPRSFVEMTAGLPHPPDLVTALGPQVPDDRVLRYLQSGETHRQFLGFSYCRFGCQLIPGSRCLTDGIWAWPDWLAHYVEVHQVPIPDEFPVTMKRNGWQIPSLVHPRNMRGRRDSSFWVEWTDRALNPHSTA